MLFQRWWRELCFIVEAIRRRWEPLTSANPTVALCFISGNEELFCCSRESIYFLPQSAATCCRWREREASREVKCRERVLLILNTEVLHIHTVRLSEDKLLSLTNSTKGSFRASWCSCDGFKPESNWMLAPVEGLAAAQVDQSACLMSSGKKFTPS